MPYFIINLVIPLRNYPPLRAIKRIGQRRKRGDCVKSESG